MQAANAFWRNTTIGLVALQLSLVQKRKTHQVKKSLPLQSPDGSDLHVSQESFPGLVQGLRSLGVIPHTAYLSTVVFSL